MGLRTTRVLAAIVTLLAGAACAFAPRAEILASPDFPLDGSWAKESALQGTSLLLTASGEGGYSVRFASAGCVGSETKQLSATFRAGHLELSEEVTEYSDTTYRRLALYRLGRRPVLVPEPDEPAFRAGDRSLAFEPRDPPRSREVP